MEKFVHKPWNSAPHLWNYGRLVIEFIEYLKLIGYKYADWRDDSASSEVETIIVLSSHIYFQKEAISVVEEYNQLCDDE